MLSITWMGVEFSLMKKSRSNLLVRETTEEIEEIEIEVWAEVAVDQVQATSALSVATLAIGKNYYEFTNHGWMDEDRWVHKKWVDEILEWMMDELWSW